MELTKRQVRALVLADQLDRGEFRDAFRTKRVDEFMLKVDGSREKPALLIAIRGQGYIAEVAACSRKVTVKDPLRFEVRFEDGWLRVLEFVD